MLQLPRFSYFPFGGGIRGCVGESFAWMEGILLLAMICHRWKMRHDPEHKVGLKPLITLRPKYGMRMKLEHKIKKDLTTNIFIVENEDNIFGQGWTIKEPFSNPPGNNELCDYCNDPYKVNSTGGSGIAGALSSDPVPNKPGFLFVENAGVATFIIYNA